MSKKDEESFYLSLNEKLLRQVLEHPGWAEIKRILDKEADGLQNEVNMPMVNESDALVKNNVLGRMEALRKVEALVRNYLGRHDLAAKNAAAKQKALQKKTSAQTRGTEQSQ